MKIHEEKNCASCSITMQQRKRKKEDEDYNVIIFGLVFKKNCNSFVDPPLWTQGISMWTVANLLVPQSKTKIQIYQSPWSVSHPGRFE